jgi:hypothetical protein
MELPLKTVRLSIPALTALFDALPPELKTPDIQRQLTDAYHRELERLIASAMHPDCQEPQVVMHLWRIAGEPPRQWIAEFHVSDLALPAGTAVNLHGQNTSRWRYAGAIVIQDGEVSTHH